MEELNEPGVSYQSFTELKVWQEARAFKMLVRQISRSFPSEEKYRLIDQVIRSSRSVNANITEGHGRRTYKDQHHFCIQARGSLSETLNHLHDAFDEGYINEEILCQAREHHQKVEALLNGYIVFLRKQIDPNK
jgi:four helix bundle protein